MLPERVKSKLKELANVDSCEFEINHKSKWVLEISLVEKLTIFAKFKFHCKNGTMERLI